MPHKISSWIHLNNFIFWIQLLSMSETNSNLWHFPKPSLLTLISFHKCVTQQQKLIHSFHRQWLLGHRWLNYLLQTEMESVFPESVSGARWSTADGGALGLEVSKSGLWRQLRGFFISCRCSRAASFISRPLMFRTCRDRIYCSSQLFDTGREKEASRINVLCTEGADFLFPSRSLQLHSLIHCRRFRRHKHWGPEDVCSLCVSPGGLDSAEIMRKML